MKEYFDNSFPAMASFFAKNNNITVDEFEEILENIKKGIQESKE
jgi:hypothetical protein